MKKNLQHIPFSSLLFMSSFICASETKEWFSETLYDDWKQSYLIDEILYEEKTPQQHLIIFKNKIYGKVLALDGAIQLTEKDECVYHEMMTHVPLLAHGNAKKVLIIGGGDGGILREVIRHQTVEKVVLVEIDASVITFSKKYLPSISQGAFEDPRVQVVIEDGCKFVKESKEKFDVIICDSTDPIGPGAVLFTSEFYGDCHQLLADGGIFVNQNGVPLLQPEELISTFKSRSLHFKDAGFYLAVIPTYVGGYMAAGWATDKKEYREVPLNVLKERIKNVKGTFKYYTPELHLASFALPQFIQNALNTQ
jgi:spermidine synthase